jgi:hypothetical protein
MSLYWESALRWPEYRETIADKREIWDASERRFELRPDERRRLESLPGPRRVLVLTEDWCGDAARSVPVIAKALAAAPLVEARYLPSDAHPDAILGYLTHGGRAIPIAVVHDGEGKEVGAWGPRPAPLQALFRARRAELGPPDEASLGDFYAPVMAWYAKDRGVTTVQELLMLLERGGEPR